MINVYFVYEITERKREKIGFSCKRYKINHLIGEYEDVDSAKKHPAFEKENEITNGYYLITPTKQEETIELSVGLDKKTKK